MYRTRAGKLARITAVALFLFASLSYVRDQVDTAQQTSNEYSVIRNVYVAIKALPVGHPIRTADIKRVAVPKQFVPHSAIRRADGRTTTSKIALGQMIVAEQVAPSGLSGAAALLPNETVAVSVERTTSTPDVVVGNHVEVDEIAETDTKGSISSVICEKAKVIAVDESSVTLAVPKETSGAIISAQSTGPVAIVLVG